MTLKDIDVLFIQPGDHKKVYQSLSDEFVAIEPPLYAGLFAEYMRVKGYTVDILDIPAEQLSADEAAEHILQTFKTKLIVLSVFGHQPSASTQNMTSASKVASSIKKLIPDCRIMMVGTHPAALPERTLREEDIDFVCQGEGPVTILETTKALQNGTSFSDVPGLWYQNGTEVCKPSKMPELITDLDAEIPGAAWDLMPMDKYRAHNWHSFGDLDNRDKYAAIHTSLGCPYRCNFCCINAPFGKPNYRMWSPETVVKEIDLLVEKYGVRHIKIVDEMFVLNKRHVSRICDLLASRPYEVNIWAYARVDTVDEELLPKLKAAGINWLCLGIESASSNVRDGANKKYSNQDIVDVVRSIQAYDIHIISNFIVGLPEDTIERMQETLDLAMELNCEFTNIYSAMAYPGSPLYDEAVQNGWDLPEEWYQYSQHSHDTKPLANKYCTSDEIVMFRDYAWNTYFNNPKYHEMLRKTFGQAEVDHVKRMAEKTLSRKGGDWRDHYSFPYEN